MNEKLDIKSTGQHWIKNNEYWCSFDYHGLLTVVKCRWYDGPNGRVLNFEWDPKIEKTIKGVSVNWFDDAEYFEYVPVINLTEDDFKPRKRILPRLNNL